MGKRLFAEAPFRNVSGGHRRSGPGEHCWCCHTPINPGSRRVYSAESKEVVNPSRDRDSRFGERLALPRHCNRFSTAAARMGKQQSGDADLSASPEGRNTCADAGQFLHHRRTETGLAEQHFGERAVDLHLGDVLDVGRDHGFALLAALDLERVESVDVALRIHHAPGRRRGVGNLEVRGHSQHARAKRCRCWPSDVTGTIKWPPRPRYGSILAVTLPIRFAKLEVFLCRREDHLFSLGQGLKMYDSIQERITDYEKEILRKLGEMDGQSAEARQCRL